MSIYLSFFWLRYHVNLRTLGWFVGWWEILVNKEIFLLFTDVVDNFQDLIFSLGIQTKVLL